MSILKQISDSNEQNRDLHPNGPRLKFDQDQLQKFQFQQIDSNSSLPPNKMKNTTHCESTILKQEISKQLTRKRRSEFKIGLYRTSFLRTINRNSLVQKFKNILLMRSYVLSKENKYLLHQDWWQRQTKRNQYTHSRIPFIISGSHVSIILTIWSLFIQIVTLWITPFMISFQQETSIFQVLFIIIIFQVFFDVFIKINSPLIVNGETIYDKTERIKDFLKKNLFEDLIYIFTLIISFFPIFDNIQWQGAFCIIIIFISYKKLNQNYESLYEILYLKGQYHYAIDVIQLTILIFSYAHVMACIWHYVGEITIEQGQSWLIQRNLQNGAIWEKYNTSFYWATMTMSTVGYGDITPTNQFETLAANLMMILSSCMFGYSISQIGMILKSQYEVQQKYKRSIIIMNAFMKNSQVDLQIQSRIRNYLKYQCENEANENKDDINKIKADLPIGLKQELVQDVQMNIMKKIKILNNQFSQSTLKQLSQYLIEFKFTPGDVIYHRNDLNDQSLYYIQEGIVNIYEENSQKLLQSLKAGETFGEYQFFSGFQSKTSVKSQGFTKIFKINRSSLLQLLNQNSKDFQRFHHIKDNIIFNQNFQIVQKCCNYCKMADHLNIDCPLLSYKPDILQRIKKADLRPSTQQRHFIQRNNEKVRCLMMHSAIKDTVEEYKANLSNTQLDDVDMKLFSTYATKDFSSHGQKESLLDKQLTRPPPVPPLKKNSSFLIRQRNQTQQKKVGIFLNLKSVYRDSDRQLKSESEDDQLNNSPKNQTSQQFQLDFNDLQMNQFDDQFQTTNFNIDRLMNYFGYMPTSNVIYALRKYERLFKYPKVKTINYHESEPRKFSIPLYYSRRDSMNELLKEKF
ncbi:unnamed protein product [Paramecium octaurelia]|uniref:Cyclic nucleotide-binding domain-containing protein n=1 Tax=Paramecium octaurelia TaxID=43137 RepID=A0A8S1UGH8_PAROT|nr:unnamed protein product [Paramecium octaurelia]